MKTISASAPPARIRPLTLISRAVRKLADFIAPSDHVGRGYRDNNSRIPILAWFGAVAFAFIFLVVLPWLGRGAGF